MKIVTDCAADMPNEELERLGIVQAPLFIQFPEGEVNAMEISADEFYNRLEAMRPQIPTTAQPSSGIFAELYRKLAKKKKNILSCSRLEVLFLSSSIFLLIKIHY